MGHIELKCISIFLIVNYLVDYYNSRTGMLIVSLRFARE